jgi:hypothetical protein
MQALPVDGITCDSAEGAVEHIHAHLQIFNRGRSVEVPAMIGIPEGGNCLYWLHTHQNDGIIHIESPVRKPFTLGEFFDVWEADLSWTHANGVVAPAGHRLAIWVDGNRYTGRDPRNIVLHDREEIVIQNGPPFATPAHYNWSQL